METDLHIPTALISKTTAELRLGDIVLRHGLRVLLDTEPDVYEDRTVWAYPGTILNPEAIAANHIPRSFTVSPYIGAPNVRHNCWLIQGNRLATWLVEVGA